MKSEIVGSHGKNQYIEHDFVEERKRDKSVTQHDLTMKITIARCGMLFVGFVSSYNDRCRLLGQVLQAEELSVELWDRVNELEARRKKRLQG